MTFKEAFESHRKIKLPEWSEYIERSTIGNILSGIYVISISAALRTDWQIEPIEIKAIRITVSNDYKSAKVEKIRGDENELILPYSPCCQVKTKLILSE